MGSNQKKAYIYAALAIFFWSTVATAFKIALRYMNPAMLVMIASVTSFLIYFFLNVFKGTLKSLFKLSLREYVFSAILGFLNPFLYYLILFKAYDLLPAQVAQPLNMVWPIVLVFLSIPILHQKIGIRSFIALFISFSGVYLISSQGKLFQPGQSNPVGIVLAIGSSLIWSVFFLLNTRDKKNETLKLNLSFFFSSFFILLFNVITGNLNLPQREGLLIGIYVGFFEMGFTFFFWMKALKLSESADKISNFVYLAPFVSLIFIHYFVGENIFSTTYIGLVLIVVGIIFQKIRS